jgi:hypothetical protein
MPTQNSTHDSALNEQAANIAAEHCRWAIRTGITANSIASALGTPSVHDWYRTNQLVARNWLRISRSTSDLNCNKG